MMNIQSQRKSKKMNDFKHIIDILKKIHIILWVNYERGKY